MKSKISKKSIIFAVATLGVILLVGLLAGLLGTGNAQTSSGNTTSASNTNVSQQTQTIKFSVENKRFSANAEMTWEQWVESEYNTDNFYIDNENFVCSVSGKILRNNNYVYKDYYVKSNANYTIDYVGTIFVVHGSNNITNSYEFSEGMTWTDWVNSHLNTDGVYIENDLVCFSELVYLKVLVNENESEYVNVSPNDLIDASFTYGLARFDGGGANTN